MNDLILTFFLINIFFIVIGVLILLIFKKIIIPKEYLEGINIILLVYIASAFYGLFKIPGLVIDYFKKNLMKTIILYFVAIIFLLGFYIFYNYINAGIYSTALSLIISNITLFIISYYFAKKIINDNKTRTSI